MLIKTITKNNVTIEGETAFKLFGLWTFVLLGRPQDVLPFLEVLRPAMSLGILTCISTYSAYRRNKISLALTEKQLKMFLVLYVIMILSIPLAYHRGFAFNFVFQKYLPNVMYLIVFYICVNSIERLKKILFICCCAVALYSLFAYLKGKSIDQRLMFGGNFDPTDLAFFLITFLPFNLIFIFFDNSILKKTLCFVNIVVSILVVLLTGSRGGFVGLVVLFSMLLFVKTSLIKFSQKILLGLICIILVLANINLINVERYKSLLDLDKDYNMTDEFGRKAVWKKGISIMFNHPITGVGVTCFPEALGYYRSEEEITPRWQAAHNSFVQIGAETGIVGLIIFCLLTFRSIKIFRQTGKYAENSQLRLIGDAAAFGFIAQVVCTIFLSQAYSVYWVFFIALSAVLSQRTERFEPDEPKDMVNL